MDITCLREEGRTLFSWPEPRIKNGNSPEIFFSKRLKKDTLPNEKVNLRIKNKL